VCDSCLRSCCRYAAQLSLYPACRSPRGLPRALQRNACAGSPGRCFCARARVLGEAANIRLRQAKTGRLVNELALLGRGLDRRHAAAVIGRCLLLSRVFARQRGPGTGREALGRPWVGGVTSAPKGAYNDRPFIDALQANDARTAFPIERLGLALRIGTTPSTARKSKSMAGNNKTAPNLIEPSKP
jgi:hypothetical protein